jgi:CubicO group peptidase (beta-lactamase class C family)
MLYVLSLLLVLMVSPAWSDPPPLTAKEAVKQLVEDAKQANSDVLLVTRRGKVVAEYQRSGVSSAPIPLKSVTQAVVALAVGMLVQEGKLASLDVPVHEYFPAWQEGRKRAITVRMLMNHTSGLQYEPPPSDEISSARDAVQLALNAELATDPGAEFNYNNKAVNLLPAIVGKAAGMPIDEYLQQRLFDPLGIRRGEWSRDPAGNPYGMTGLALKAADLVKLGQLVLDEGQWQGRQMLPVEFVRQMLAPQPDCAECALLWWRATLWSDVRVASEAPQKLRAAGVTEPVIAGFVKLQGQRFDSFSTFFDALRDIFGEDGQGLMTREVLDRKLGMNDVLNITSGPMLYHGSGEFGQFMVIVPKVNLVAVRQVAALDDVYGEEGADEFIRQVIALAAALDPSLRRK